MADGGDDAAAAAAAADAAPASRSSSSSSDEEAEAFTSTCKQHFDRSLAGDQLSPVRTSYQCWCSGNECEAHRLTQIVAERIANVTRSQVRSHL